MGASLWGLAWNPFLRSAWCDELEERRSGRYKFEKALVVCSA